MKQLQKVSHRGFDMSFNRHGVLKSTFKSVYIYHYNYEY